MATFQFMTFTNSCIPVDSKSLSCISLKWVFKIYFSEWIIYFTKQNILSIYYSEYSY